MKKTNQNRWHKIVTFAVIFLYVLPPFLRGQRFDPPPPDTVWDVYMVSRKSGIYSSKDVIRNNSENHFPENHVSFINQSNSKNSLQRCKRRYSDIPVIPDADSSLMHLMIPVNLLYADVQILDSHGRLWTETKADKTKFSINIRSWPPGNYLVILSNHRRLCQGNFTKL